VRLRAVDTAGEPMPAPSGSRLAGPLWVEARPNLRRTHVLAGDILAALGKRRDIAGKGRNEHDDIRHACAWLRAHDVTELVVTHAQRLHPKILGSLVRLAARAGAEDLWLVHQPPRTDQFQRSLTRRGAAPLHVADLPPFAEPAAREAAADPHQPLPAVPRTEFVTFRADYRRRLDPCDAARVDARFNQTAGRCHQQLSSRGPTRECVADLLHAILNTAPPDAELIVDVRALQTAAWHHDLYIKIDLDRLTRSEERPRLPPAAVDDALAAYRQPYRALCATLGRVGHGVADIAAVAILDTDAQLGAITCRGHEVRLGPAAHRALRAQLWLRADAGADAGDPLLPHTPKALAKALADAAVDLGVRVHGRRAERSRDHTQGGLRALGVTITALP
jgi:hypothetical protein